MKSSGCYLEQAEHEVRESESIRNPETIREDRRCTFESEPVQECVCMSRSQLIKSHNLPHTRHPATIERSSWTWNVARSPSLRLSNLRMLMCNQKCVKDLVHRYVLHSIIGVRSRGWWLRRVVVELKWTSTWKWPRDGQHSFIHWRSYAGRL